MKKRKKTEKRMLSELFGYDFRVGYYIFYLTRLQFTVLSIGTLMLGWTIASLTMIPSPQVIIGIIVIGPLVGGFTLIYNEYCDIETDVINPLKKDSPLIRGLIEPKTAYNVAITFALMSIIIAYVVSYVFVVFILILLFLAVVYSHPTTRLKSMGGMDLLVNMVGFGVICPLAGWSLARPILEFPILYLIPVSFVIGGLYIPTVIRDYEADKAMGIRSLAVIYGKKNTMLLGMVLIIFAVGLGILEGYFNYLITREIMLKIWPVFAMQIPIYWLFFKTPTSQNIIAGTLVVGLLNIIGTFLYLLLHTGVWKI